MPGTGELILHTITGLLSLAILVIMVRYLLWPLFQKQPYIVVASFAFAAIAIGLMIAFDI